MAGEGERASAVDFLALVGPTACGKTPLSLRLAAELDAEIVSMDSRQVYAGMDIGTAKVEAEARAHIPHHGLDLVRPDEAYSAGRFARDARRWVQEIRGRGRLPLLVGGSGFFLRALTEPIFREPPLEPARRKALRGWLDRQPRERLVRWVRALDPDRAEVAEAGGPQRLGRAVEVALLSGRPLSLWHRTAEPEGDALGGLVVHLELPREEMDRRIDRRVDAMLEAGLVDEVRRLEAAGYDREDPGMSGVGYREILASLRGETTLEDAADEIRRATRAYARRQLTWFRHQLPGEVIRLDATLPIEVQARLVREAWARWVNGEQEWG